MVNQARGQLLALLGGGGDLAMRMLLPSLYNLDSDRLLPGDLCIIAVARHQMAGDGAFAAMAHEALTGRAKVDDGVADAWKQADVKPDVYLSGAWGLEAAQALLGPGRRWHV